MNSLAAPLPPWSALTPDTAPPEHLPPVEAGGDFWPSVTADGAVKVGGHEVSLVIETDGTLTVDVLTAQAGAKVRLVVDDKIVVGEPIAS